jgi:hypothetical protein
MAPWRALPRRGKVASAAPPRAIKNKTTPPAKRRPAAINPVPGINAPSSVQVSTQAKPWPSEVA